MRDYKEEINDIQNNVQDLNEISNTNHGLESVAEGCDFAEGEKDKPPKCDGV